MINLIYPCRIRIEISGPVVILRLYATIVQRCDCHVLSKLTSAPASISFTAEGEIPSSETLKDGEDKKATCNSVPPPVPSLSLRSINPNIGHSSIVNRGLSPFVFH
ncbi:hypothetical protein P3342_006555 [Pyrenophora teres f. teres]|nr:hypothetical protein P3342_006555 [Pyrenophora teres f. teres]